MSGRGDDHRPNSATSSPASAFLLCAVSRKRTGRADAFIENQFAQCTQDRHNMAPKWANSLRFSAELPSIRLHSQLSLSLGKKESPECLGYTLMPTVKFPVVLTACKTSREVWPVLETLTRASDINTTEVLCQVKKKMSMPGLDQATHQFPRRKLDFREKNKTDQKQQSSALGKILYYFRMMLTDDLSNSLKT